MQPQQARATSQGAAIHRVINVNNIGEGRTGFDRDRLPDPANYYEAQGLVFRERRGKWRTTRCNFHGGTDSLRINLHSGAFVCMAGCGVRGGDVLAYEMAVTGSDFIAAARMLGAWIEGANAPQHTRPPAPFTARQALQVLADEVQLVAVFASNAAHGVTLSDTDRARFMQAAGRILRIAEVSA